MMAENRFKKYVQPQQGVVFTDPNAANEEARAAEDQELQRRKFELDRQRAEIDSVLADIKIRESQMGLNEAEREQETTQGKIVRKSVSDRMKYGNVLEAIKAARIAAKAGGTGFGSLLSGLPETQARALENAISPIKGNLAFDRISEMRSDPDNKTGGAVGSVTERELDLLASTVASLDTGVSKDQFLANLDRIERHFVASQMGLAGIDPYSEEGTKIFSDFGVRMPEQKMSQAGLDATTQSGRPIPPEMQAENEALLTAWMQNPDPDIWARERTAIDEKYGFPSDYARNRAWATDVAIPALREGATIGGAIPPPEEPLQGIDWLMNAATAEPTGTGAFLASMGNAGGFGIPTVLAGRDRMETLRGQSPIASTLGEVTGGTIGALTGGALAGAGSRAIGGGTIAELLANPVAADVGYGAIYGATQAEDPVYGALTGAGAAFAGNKIGGAIARELPGLVGMGGAVRAADEAVPTIDALKTQADDLYTAARGSGGVVDPQATQGMQQQARTLLASEGRVLPDGSLSLGSMPKVKDAIDILDAYAGQPMTAAQSDAARKVIADAAGSMDKSEARVGRLLRDQFDATVEPFVPGFGEARDVASRYLNAEDIALARELADPRSAQYSQSGLENALRTEFRALDRNAIRGRGQYGDLVTEAVENVSRGTPVSNATRWMGKFAPRGVVSTGASAGPAFYVGNAMGGPVAGAGLAGGVMGMGELGKRMSEKLVSREAEIAELLARGGSDYADELGGVLDTAAQRGGSAFAGAFSPVASALLGLTDEEAEELNRQGNVQAQLYQ